MAQRRSATVQLTEGMTFRASADSGHEVRLGDGSSEDPTPMELVLMALGGCTAIDVISILRKMRQDVTDYRVEVHGARADDHPRVYTELEVVHVVTGRQLKREMVQRAVDLSAGTYCSVSAMLAASAQVTHRLELVEAVAT